MTAMRPSELSEELARLERDLAALERSVRGANRLHVLGADVPRVLRELRDGIASVRRGMSVRTDVPRDLVDGFERLFARCEAVHETAVTLRESAASSVIRR